MTLEQRLERLEWENRWMRRIGVVGLAMLVGCASSDIDSQAGMAASWGPSGPDSNVSAISERLAKYDIVVVVEPDAETQDDDTQSAAKIFRWILVAEFEALDIYPTVTPVTTSSAQPLQVHATVHRCRKNPPENTIAPDSEFDVSVKVCDGRTGDPLCWRHVTSSASGLMAPGWREVVWSAASDVAQWLNALKEGREPHLGPPAGGSPRFDAKGNDTWPAPR